MSKNLNKLRRKQKEERNYKEGK